MKKRDYYPDLPATATVFEFTDPIMQQLAHKSRDALAAGKLTEERAKALADWVQTNAPHGPSWPLNDVLRRINRIFADGHMDEDERKELQGVLKTLSGKNRLPPHHGTPKTLPLTTPAPDPVIHAGKQFALTGKFSFGPRYVIQQQIRELGGRMPKDCAITEETDFLIVGELQDYSRSVETWSSNIESAVQMRAAGHKIAIISESHWRRFVGTT